MPSHFCTIRSIGLYRVTLNYNFNKNPSTTFEISHQQTHKPCRRTNRHAVSVSTPRCLPDGFETHLWQVLVLSRSRFTSFSCQFSTKQNCYSQTWFHWTVNISGMLYDLLSGLQCLVHLRVLFTKSCQNSLVFLVSLRQRGFFVSPFDRVLCNLLSHHLQLLLIRQTRICDDNHCLHESYA